MRYRLSRMWHAPRAGAPSAVAWAPTSHRPCRRAAPGWGPVHPTHDEIQSLADPRGRSVSGKAAFENERRGPGVLRGAALISRPFGELSRPPCASEHGAPCTAECGVSPRSTSPWSCHPLRRSRPRTGQLGSSQTGIRTAVGGGVSIMRCSKKPAARRYCPWYRRGRGWCVTRCRPHVRIISLLAPQRCRKVGAPPSVSQACPPELGGNSALMFCLTPTWNARAPPPLGLVLPPGTGGMATGRHLVHYSIATSMPSGSLEASSFLLAIRRRSSRSASYRRGPTG